MNDLISKSLRSISFVFTATAAGWALHQIGLSHAISDVVGHFNPSTQESLAIFLTPLLGVGAAEFLSARGVQRCFWKFAPGHFKRWVQGGCPDLSGLWNVTWRSNDSINKALHDSYLSGMASSTPLEKIALVEYAGQFDLAVTPVHVCVRLHQATVTDSNSSTVARLYRENNGDVILTYQSQPTVHAPSARDAASYNFSARLKLDEVSGQLKGHYCTDRAFAAGQNTAGYLTAQRA